METRRDKLVRLGDDQEIKVSQGSPPSALPHPGLADRQYEYKYSKEYLKRIEPHKEFTHDRNLVAESAPVGEMNEEDAFNESTTSEGPVKAGGSDIPGENEAMDVPMRPEEKRRLNWDNGIYLAPLTTVGNLVSRSDDHVH